jgi:hypothetical protein
MVYVTLMVAHVGGGGGDDDDSRHFTIKQYTFFLFSSWCIVTFSSEG